MRKKFVNFSIISTAIAGLILFFGKKSWFPDFYWPNFFAFMALVMIFLIILPKIIWRSNDENKKEIVVKLQFYTAFALMLNGLGSLGLFQLYRYGIPYDKIVHFIVPMTATIVLSQFINEWENWKIDKAILAAAIIVMAGGFAWEILEFLSDLILKTKAFGVYGEYINKDTIMDIFFNTLGIIAGTVFILKRN